MRCNWCEGEKEPFPGGGGLRFCSTKCRNSALRWAAAATEAMFDGEDPPSKEEFKNRQQSARRWTPGAMKDRVNELVSTAEDTA